MTDRAYNRTANALMLVGVASALAFDSGRIPHVLAGCVGGIAGFGALILYFCGSKETAAKEEAVKEAPIPASTDAGVMSVTGAAMELQKTASIDALIAYNLMFGAKDPGFFVYDAFSARRHRVASAWEAHADGIEAYRRETAKMWLSSYALDHARKLHWSVIAAASNKTLMEPEVELSPNEVAACAVHIIRALAIGADANRWEYALGPKGLRVAYRGSAPMEVVREPQEDFDFGDATVAYRFVK
jgi:hypothetical protein